MADAKAPVDAVIVGLGWTGAILAMELCEAGLNVVALERGPARDTVPDFEYPRITDELPFGVRGDLFQDFRRETVTIRHTPKDTALPYRQYGSFLPGNGVGGAGVHWNGQHYRPLPEELVLASHTRARYGAKFMPPTMQIQDYGVTYDELEPYLARFERVCGVSGKAGNLRGKIVDGGNPFEGPRDEYPLPANPNLYCASLFEKAARDLGYHPFPQPSSNASQSYTNEYGGQLGPCNFCGYCERFGCYIYAKASPQTTILPRLLLQKNFELRANSHVLRVNLTDDQQHATGVTYVDAQGRETEQPASLVVLCAFQLHNVRLLLLSGIGKPYDPASGQGVVGRNYAYQMTANVGLFFDENTYINPFIGAGAAGAQIIDDFHTEEYDRGPLGFVGGAYVGCIQTGGRPIQQMPLPEGTPAWGLGWKHAIKRHYLHSTTLTVHGSVMADRDNFLDLDPTYRDVHGQPLLRMTFDWKDNEYRMVRYITDKTHEIGRAMNPQQTSVVIRQPGNRYDVRQYQTTHTVGGAPMGEDRSTSAVNRYLQTWDVPNVFVMGASAFPQNLGYNPTGLVGGLAYWSAKAIREQYLKSPGPLVQA